MSVIQDNPKDNSIFTAIKNIQELEKKAYSTGYQKGFKDGLAKGTEIIGQAEEAQIINEKYNKEI